MKAITKPLRRALIAAGRNFFAPRAARRHADWPEDRSGVSVHMVVGHTMLAMGLLALRSWEFHTRRRWPLIVHDDGSFTDEDRHTLRAHFPQVRIVDRAQADEEVAAGLEEFPACRRHRMNHHWFLKVFDTRHYAPNHRYLIIDSDIVFFQNPSLVVDWVDRGSDEMWIMEDEREKYSQPRSELESAMGMSVLQKGNSGLDLMNKAAADLALANRFLEWCAANARQYEFLEQTIFSLWASAWGNGGLLPREQYEISWNNFRGKQAVCRHYIGPAKNDALYVEGAPVFWWQSRAA